MRLGFSLGRYKIKLRDTGFAESVHSLLDAFAIAKGQEKSGLRAQEGSRYLLTVVN